MQNDGGLNEAKRVMAECKDKAGKIHERIDKDEFVKTATKVTKYENLISKAKKTKDALSQFQSKSEFLDPTLLEQLQTLNAGDYDL